MEKLIRNYEENKGQMQKQIRQLEKQMTESKTGLLEGYKKLTEQNMQSQTYKMTIDKMAEELEEKKQTISKLKDEILSNEKQLRELKRDTRTRSTTDLSTERLLQHVSVNKSQQFNNSTSQFNLNKSYSNNHLGLLPSSSLRKFTDDQSYFKRKPDYLQNN